MSTDILSRRFGYLENLETYTCDEIPEVIQEPRDLKVPFRCEVILKFAGCVLCKVVALQSIHCGSEGLRNVM